MSFDYTDLAGITISSNLKTFIAENCSIGQNKNAWEQAMPGIEFVGWDREIGLAETVSFNNLGIYSSFTSFMFGGPEGNLLSYLNDLFNFLSPLPLPTPSEAPNETPEPNEPTKGF